MRVDGLGRATASPMSGQRTPAAGGAFRLPDAQGGEAARGAAPLRAAPSLDALIALQEMIETPTERRRKAVKRGRGLLDSLDALKLALLDGRVDDRALATMSARLDGGRERTGDPGLDDTLAAIDLRVRVELAKRRG
ncbi:flagellar assembly protein FliX [Methylopila capsulata]|nr:flagellar assembly protein FliX [Methylopila capsulata]